MFERDYLVIKTDQMFNIWIQSVSSVNKRLAQRKAEALGKWREVLFDDEVLEYFEDIYPNDIQVVMI